MNWPSLTQLDAAFPFVVFVYGALMTFVLYSPPLQKLADQNFNPTLVQQMRAHRALAVISFIVGGLWALQNIWL